MPPLYLDEPELAAIMSAAVPLAPRDRPAFLAECAAALRGQGAEHIGVGLIHRVIAPIQRRYRDPPDLTGSVAKYG